MSSSLWPHRLQHARPPCPSPTSGACSISCPLSRWHHPTISSSVIPISCCLQSFPASKSFPMSQFFASGGQSIGVSTSASVLAMNIWDWSPLGWTDWISLQSQGLSRVFSSTTVPNTAVSVLVCVGCLFSLKLRLAWLLLIQCFSCILDIWGIMVWDSGYHFSLFQQAFSDTVLVGKRGYCLAYCVEGWKDTFSTVPPWTPWMGKVCLIIAGQSGHVDSLQASPDATLKGALLCLNQGDWLPLEGGESFSPPARHLWCHPAGRGVEGDASLKPENGPLLGPFFANGHQSGGVVRSLSHVQLFATPWTAARQASPSVTICWSLLRSCDVSQWCHPTISSSQK